MPKLESYQVAGAEHLLSALQEIRPERRVRILGDDPGLGKTATGSVVIGELVKRTGKRGIVLCPASLRNVWRDELKKWSVDVPSYIPSKSDDVISWDPASSLLILSYDTLGAIMKNKAEVWRSLLSKTACISWIVADEVQKIRKAESIRSLAINNLLRRARDHRVVALVLSGSIIENDPLDLWIILDRLGLRREIFPGGIAEFAAHFGGVYNPFERRWRFARRPPGGSVVPRLMQSGIFLARTVAEAKGDLPPKTYKVTVCPTGGRLRGLVNLMLRAVGASPTDQGVGEKVADLVMASGGNFDFLGDLSRLRKESAEDKIPTLLARLDHLEEHEEGPFVVYSEHRSPIDTLRDREGWAVITSDETPKQRSSIVAAFQAGEYRGIGITSAVREGWTLTRSNYFICVSPSWLSTHMDQSEGRVWRFGQERPVTIELLISDHDIDRAVFRRIGEGRQRNGATWEVTCE